MAYIADTGDPRFPQIYNVNFPVGVNSPNKRDDVLLVQWLLHRVYTDVPSLTPPEENDIAIDGWIGPQTVKWIRAFQRDVRKVGGSCWLDGRVDRAHGGTNITKTIYTIVWLNVFFAGANPSLFINPSTDPAMPQELLAALVTNSDSVGPYLDAPQPVPASGGL